MFSVSQIRAAKQRINGEFKAYLTSDNCLYVQKRTESLDSLKKHCSDNSIVLFDVEENKEIELKKIKNGTTES